MATDSKSPRLEKADRQLLKIREMREILEFDLTTEATGDERLKPLKPAPGFEQESYHASHLRKEIEPWLTALFQSEHLSLLSGAGLTTAVHYHVTGQAPDGFSNRTYAAFDKQVQAEAKRSAQETGRGEPNPEDQLRSALRIADGLSILVSGNADSEPWKSLATELATLETDIEAAIEALITGILSPERLVRSQNEKRETALLMLVSFLMSFASRTGTRDRLHIFTTNYDRLIEFGAELAGIRLIDRFVGSLSPLFRASRLDVDLHYNPPGIRGEPRYLEGVARFTKLHGSLDWVDEHRQVRRIALPFGAKEYKRYLPEGAQNVLIYPNDAKDRETTDYPYIELHRDFAAAVCRPNSVLVTYGYSFGDDHINRVIRDMLTIPSTHLVILNHGDTGGRVTKFYCESKRISQITLLIGSHFGKLANLVDYYLPKPAIDRASIRMADLLRARGMADKLKDDSPKNPAVLQDKTVDQTGSEEL
jgi:SIR2-like domain